MKESPKKEELQEDIPKQLILQKISTIPEEKRIFLNFNWKSEGFNQVIHRLQKLKTIESQVIVKKRLVKMSEGISRATTAIARVFVIFLFPC